MGRVPYIPMKTLQFETLASHPPIGHCWLFLGRLQELEFATRELHQLSQLVEGEELAKESMKVGRKMGWFCLVEVVVVVAVVVVVTKASLEARRSF